MSKRIEQSVREQGDGRISRRRLLISLSAMALAPNLAGKFARWMPQPQAPKAPFGAARTESLRALRRRCAAVRGPFYQGFSACPFKRAGNRRNSSACRHGNSIYCLAGVGGNARTGVIDHFSINMERFSVDAAIKAFADHGVARSDNPATSPMTAWVRMRGPAQGGAPEGTRSFYFNDPDGIKGQVQDLSYCGGAGVLGNVCPPLAQAAGLDAAPIALRGLSHFTLTTTNPQRSLEFYQGLFGMPIQTHQGNTPLPAHRPWAAIRGSGRRAQRHPRHQSLLHDHGEFQSRPRHEDSRRSRVAKGEPGKTPMTAWVRMRGPAQGGAPEEQRNFISMIPTGITVQLQGRSLLRRLGRPRKRLPLTERVA